ncbi:hypothetical protein AOC05_00260 [Arthrobacter alpinus]|uniref:Uncharacterized protein n=1 Tax=Arthrobacter alpinus TaxID=656366 RepID=A0A0M4RLP0_9MICC|nr:hypothetical protein AOC05_00260 [Arthrobacter alpinus]
MSGSQQASLAGRAFRLINILVGQHDRFSTKDTRGNFFSDHLHTQRLFQELGKNFAVKSIPVCGLTKIIGMLGSNICRLTSDACRIPEFIAAMFNWVKTAQIENPGEFPNGSNRITHALPSVTLHKMASKNNFIPCPINSHVSKSRPIALPSDAIDPNKRHGGFKGLEIPGRS